MLLLAAALASGAPATPADPSPAELPMAEPEDARSAVGPGTLISAFIGWPTGPMGELGGDVGAVPAMARDGDAVGTDAAKQAAAEVETELGMLRAEVDDLYNGMQIDKAEARVDWSQPAEAVDRLIRGLSPFPGAWCEIGGERVKLLHSEPAEGQGAPGDVLDDALTVACGSGAVRLTRLQRAGKAAQDSRTFLRGWPVARGTRL